MTVFARSIATRIGRGAGFGRMRPRRERLPEALAKLTLVDIYAGRRPAILTRRAQITQRTLAQRQRENLILAADSGSTAGRLFSAITVVVQIRLTKYREP